MRIRDDLARVKRKTLLDVQSLSRAHTRTAVRVLASIMNDPATPPAVRVRAAKILARYRDDIAAVDKDSPRT
jgi:hypothetical protein